MADIDGQTTDQLTQELIPDKQVLYRGFMSISTPSVGGYTPYYSAIGSKDISFLNFTTLIPQVEVYEQQDATTYKKCPYTDVRVSAGTIDRQVIVQILEGSSKTSGDNTLLMRITVINRIADVTPKRFFYTITNKLAADATLELFENNGSFSS